MAVPFSYTGSVNSCPGTVPPLSPGEAGDTTGPAAAGIAEEELAAMEQTLDRLRLRYGINPGTL